MNQYQQWMTDNVTPPVRGMCHHYSRMMAVDFPELRLAKGWYEDLAGTSHGHWWCVTESGIIIDPTVSQFLAGGTYKEYCGPESTGRCLNCGNWLFEFGNFCDSGCEQCFKDSLNGSTCH